MPGGLVDFVSAARRAGEANPGGFSPAVTVAIIAVMGLVTGLARQRAIQRLMMARSSEAIDAAPADAPAVANPAAQPPRVLRCNASRGLAGAVKIREALVDRTLTVYRRAWREELVITLGYWVIPHYPALLGAKAFATNGNIEYLAFMYLFWATLRRLSLHAALRPADDSLPRALVTSLFASWGGRVARPEHRIYLDIALIAIALWSGIDDWPTSGWAYSSGPIVAALFHIAVLWQRSGSLKDVPNLKLTVLRVFDMDKAAKLTFNGLLTYWRHFGSFFTVVDISYLQSENKGAVRFLLAAAAAFVVQALAESHLAFVKGHEAEFGQYVLVPVTLLLCTAYLVYALKSLPSRFVRNEADLSRRLHRLDAAPRDGSLTFKNLPLMCFDNTWKITVSACVQASAAVLMDLRGYSPERKGCEYEVGYLLDVVPVGRIVFLADPDGFDRVEKLILDRWPLMRATSPNGGPGRKALHIHVASEEDDTAVQSILDWVLMAANPGPAAASKR